MIKRYRTYIITTKINIEPSLCGLVKVIHDYQLPILFGKYECILYEKCDTCNDDINIYDLIMRIYEYEDPHTELLLKNIKIIKNFIKLELVTYRGEVI